MKNKFTLFIALAALAAAAIGCNMSTANMSSFKTSTDKDGKQETTTFKAGETIYANAVISNSGGKTTTRFYLVADDAPGLKKGETVPGSEVKVDLPSAGTAQYSLPIPAGIASGKFTLNAEMLDEKGEKKDSKSSAVSIEGSPSGAPAKSSDSSKDDKSSTDKDDDDN